MIVLFNFLKEADHLEIIEILNCENKILKKVF